MDKKLQILDKKKRYVHLPDMAATTTKNNQTACIFMLISRLMERIKAKCNVKEMEKSNSALNFYLVNFVSILFIATKWYKKIKKKKCNAG